MRLCLLWTVAMATHLSLAYGKVVRWDLPDVDLSLVDGKIHATLNVPLKAKGAVFFMNVGDSVTFRNPQYKFRLSCQPNEISGKTCTGTGGPLISPADVIFYGMKVRLTKKRTMRFKNKKWTPVVATESPFPPPEWISPVSFTYGKVYTFEVPERGFGVDSRWGL